MTELSKPSRELATKVLRKLSYDKRLRLVWQNGESEIGESIYSFEEAIQFLGMDEANLAGRAGLPSTVDFNALKEWVDNAIGDKELALAIFELMKQGGDPMGPYQRELIKPIKQLMEQRLKQCKEAPKEEITA